MFLYFPKNSKKTTDRANAHLWWQPPPWPPFLFNPLCPCIKSSQLWVAAAPTPDISSHCTVAFPQWRSITGTGLDPVHSWVLLQKPSCRTGQLWHKLALLLCPGSCRRAVQHFDFPQEQLTLLSRYKFYLVVFWAVFCCIFITII